RHTRFSRDWSSDVCSSDLEDLLPYLVRRLLENGANSSLVNRISDEDVPSEDLVRDPIEIVEGYQSIPHPQIPLPGDLYRSQGVRSEERRVGKGARCCAAAA